MIQSNIKQILDTLEMLQEQLLSLPDDMIQPESMKIYLREDRDAEK